MKWCCVSPVHAVHLSMYVIVLGSSQFGQVSVSVCVCMV